MSHTAFEPQEVFQKGQKWRVRAVTSWHNAVVVGCSDQAIRVFQPQINGGYREKCVKNFCSKEITQLEVVESLGILLSISDSAFRVHDIPQFKVRVEKKDARGAHMFALSRTSTTKGNQSRPLYLCIAKKKQLMVYRWNVSEFVSYRNLYVPEKVRMVIWAGPQAQSLVLGLRTNYNIMKISDGRVTNIYPGIRVKRTVACLLENNEIVLALENKGFYIDFDGKPTRVSPHAINWNDVPLLLLHAYPYCIGLFQNFVEVRNMKTSVVAQEFSSFKGFRYGSAKMYQVDDRMEPRLIIASEKECLVLNPVPFPKQLEILVRGFHFEEALAVASILDEAEFYSFEADKKREIAKIHERYAYYLFDQRDYNGAMMQFQESDTDPRRILSLFPQVLPKGQCLMGRREHPVDVQLDGADNGGLLKALSALIPYLNHIRNSHRQNRDNTELNGNREANVQLSMSSKLLGRPAVRSISHQQGEMPLPVLIDTVLLKAYLITDDELVIPFLSQPNECDIEASGEILRFHSKNVERVTLLKTRGRHSQALHLLQKMGMNTTEAVGTGKTVEYLQELGREARHSNMVLEFSKWVLQQDPEEGLRIFTGEVSNGSSEEPMMPVINREQVLNHLSQYADRQIRIKYLETLIHEHGDANPKFHNELVKLYMKCVSDEIWKRNRRDNEVRAKFGFAENDYIITLTDMKVGEVTLEAGTEAYVRTFENREGVMFVWIVAEKIKTMTDVPISDVKRAGTKRKSKPLGKEPGTLGLLRKKLIDFLDTSNGYNPNKMIKLFPRGELLEEQCRILSRVPKHDQALQIYAYQLKNWKEAEKYCDKIYNQYLDAVGGEDLSDEMPTGDPLNYVVDGFSPLDENLANKVKAARNVYVTLLEVYLNPPGKAGTNALLGPALELLQKRYNRIDPVQVVALLPSATRLYLCLPYFNAVLAKQAAVKKRNQVIHHLLKKEQLQLETAKRTLERTFVEISDDRRCSQCRMRIGKSAFALYRSGTVVHYVCIEDKTIDPVTRRNYS